MRVASIIAENSSTAAAQIKQALPFADVIELRLDYWSTFDLAAIAELRAQITLPVIFTLRRQDQGGRCDWPEAQRLNCIQQLAALSPTYFDLEYDVAEDFVKQLSQDFPQLQLIGSYHDFSQTPPLPELWQKIYRPLFHIFKIATFAHSASDTLRLLQFTQDHNQQYALISMAMGEYGQISRILAPVVGSLFTYGSIDAENTAAPGQISLAELTQVYRVQELNRNTQMYALLGNPVSQSPGHLFHNARFKDLEKNAVYVKLRVEAEDLAETISLSRQLPFAGFSVTIPHKEEVAGLVDVLTEQVQELRIVNTIKRQNGQYLGFNTDGEGSVDVLAAELPLAGQKVLILGAGGSAKAIAYALLQQGALVTLCNRTQARAESFAAQYGVDVMDFSELLRLDTLDFAAIINTLPGDAFAEVCTNWQIPAANEGQIAMDIVLKPLETLFLQKAGKASWRCINGEALFHAQAERQLKIWF